MERAPPQIPHEGEAGCAPDPQESAREAGLRYVAPDEPGLTRRRAGKGFVYVDADGRAVRDPETLARIRKLAIPPAYADVWICAEARGHLQATGRDARGRKQYRYHPDWTQARDSVKYEGLAAFAAALPKLRRRVAAHMRRPGLGRRKALAAVVHLLDRTLIRVGNEDYARENDSYGLTTLRTRHVRVEKDELRFQFKGKSGRAWRLSMRDRRVARVVRDIQELPGQNLFQYLDGKGRLRAVASSDVNDYLREIAGEGVTAKAFRTWAGTVLAAAALAEGAPAQTAKAGKARLRAVVHAVSARLGNTPTICRKCYVHPRVFEAYLAGALQRDFARAYARAREGAAFSRAEAATLAFLRAQDRAAAHVPAARRGAPKRNAR